MTVQHTPPEHILSISHTERTPETQFFSPAHGAGHGGRPTKLLNHVGFAIVCILIFYAVLLWQGYPQQWTEALKDEIHATTAATGVTQATVETETMENLSADDSSTEKSKFKKGRPPFFLAFPFVVLLLCIAFFPLIPAIAHWWEHNLNKFMVGTSLGALVLFYYLVDCDFSISLHWPNESIVEPTMGGLNFAIAGAVFVNAIVYEFLPFIVLLFSLFVITGGIRVHSSLKATPFVNTVILAIGTVLASFIGTTGAAALLIRPLLDMNRGRKHKVHTVIFFIFCVCNCGGMLTPLGDPPIFLGYLRGVPFEWPLLALWPMWLFMNGILLTIYFIWDRFLSYPHECETYKGKKCDPTQKKFAVSGWHLNGPLLLGVIAAIAFLDPGRAVPGTDWHPWFYMREAAQLGLAAISLFFSSLLIRKENVFNFLSIGEVAAVFFGIFLCMQAPLQILGIEGKPLISNAQQATGISQDRLLYWTTASLSTVLDNAPTYIVFFEAGKSMTPNSVARIEADRKEDGSPKWKWENGQWRCVDGVHKLIPIRGGFIEHYLLVAIALGTIFVGAVTYIANAPNFLVKSIAEQDGVPMPSFFGFMAYSCLIIVPLMILVMLIFIP